MGMTALEEPPPRAKDQLLQAPSPRTLGRRDVLNEYEPSAWAQDPTDLRERRLRVGHGTQNEGAHHEIDTSIWEPRGVRAAHHNIDRDLVFRRCGTKGIVHVGVGLDGDDASARREVAKIRPRSRANLDDFTGVIGEQFPLATAKKHVDVIVEKPKEPGVHPTTNWIVVCHPRSVWSRPLHCMSRR